MLQVLEDDSDMRVTQYGNRDVPVTYVLPIFNDEGDLHIELVAAGVYSLLLKVVVTPRSNHP